MNKKKLLILLAIVVVIAVPFSVFAATSDTSAAKTVRGFFGIDTSKLNDQQKSDIKDYSTKMANLQKEFINKMVANGSMTKDQGDAAIKKIDDMLTKGSSSDFLFGMGKGGHGNNGNYRKNFIDTSKLTTAQITDLTAIYKKLAVQQKATITKMVANGLLTQAQADSASKAADDMLTKIGTTGLFIGRGGFEGFGSFGKFRIDTSKLTDTQKADLTDASKKMAELHKELINKMVDFSLLTKDQGEAAIKKIDAMQSTGILNGFSKNSGMRKGKFSGQGNQEAPNAAGVSAQNTKKYF